MLRSELVRELRNKNPDIRPAQIEAMVDIVFESISLALERGDRVELRGFGAFSVRERDARQGRNPRTGVSVDVGAKRVPFFKAGKELRHKVNVGPEAVRSD
ncbi:MAG: integration host factor subunit beta [Alphaproteobacteria bacterium]|jgi:integration host factor subunit beta|nr:integration host factor subunit beta [Alphaproteobacteria bacterium]